MCTIVQLIVRSYKRRLETPGRRLPTNDSARHHRFGRVFASMTLGHWSADPVLARTAGHDHPRSNDPCHRGCAAVRLQPEHPASVGRCAAVGSRRVPRLPRGMSTAADDGTAAARARQRCRLDRLVCLPRRSPADRIPGPETSPSGEPLSRLPSYSGWRLWSPYPCGPFLTKSGETRE
jgi:hypothetical protein